MEKVYNFKDFETKIDALWNNNKLFAPQQTNTEAKPFVVVIPPPNVTGILHMGHGLNNTIQDVLVRYHRMQGRPALWVPGSDHAGIATQQVMERKLAEEGLTRQELGRKEFIARTWDLSLAHKQIIINQLRRLGASVDWDRERFTLDEPLSDAVKRVFVDLYNKGLIYKGDYLVNWSVGAGTAISDDEVVYKEVQGKLYSLRYPLEEDASKYIIVATTRPETMLGDTAVAVHPEDERYKDLVGKKVALPLTEKTISIIADSYVDAEFGTGAVKITPAHDPNDYEMAKRHNLDIITILSTDGTLNQNAPEAYRGLSAKEARTQIIADLETQGLLEQVEDYTHKVGHCYRTDCVIEPLFSSQWFVRMDGMAKKALQALEDDKIRFYPKHWESTYVHWLNNIRDWCISRQLWWGHRIPVWYNDDTGEIIVSAEDPTKDPKYAGQNLRQETDVLDTWFSSWLWPFSVMGWPAQTKDLDMFYPNSTLVTAYDIIFFWVARMIMAGLEFTGEVPFRDIFLHGLVRDDKGKKMSKSLGNGIDPLEIMDEYGSDALKFTLTFMCKLGGEVLLNREHFQLGSKFANKIWNASRFLLMHVENTQYKSIEALELVEVDKWIIVRMQETINHIESAIQQYRLDDAARIVYEYFWTDFCDWYVEASKVSLHSESEPERRRASTVLLWVLIQNLKILHPFVPFISEEIYQNIRAMLGNALGEEGQYLTVSHYPKLSDETLDALGLDKAGATGIVANFSQLQELVTGLRTLRSEFNLSPKLKLATKVYIDAKPNGKGNGGLAEYFKNQRELIAFLVGAEPLAIINKGGKPAAANEAQDNDIGVEGANFTAMVDIKALIDIAQELARIEKRLQKLQAQQKSIVGRLNNKDFVAKAKSEYVEEIRQQEAAIARKVAQLEVFAQRLQNSG